MKLKLIDKPRSSVDVNDVIFSQPYNQGLVHQFVVGYLANQRSGSKAQKTRSEVRGGGAKPWRQKGTGRARAGTIRSPLWRGGGITFAAKPRSYHQKINKKMYKKAMCSILSELNRTERLLVVDELACKTAKTKELVKQLEALKLNNVLIVMDEIEDNMYLASRNLHQVGLVDSMGVNPVNLLGYEKVLMAKTALARLEERLQ